MPIGEPWWTGPRWRAGQCPVAGPCNCCGVCQPRLAPSDEPSEFEKCDERKRVADLLGL